MINLKYFFKNSSLFFKNIKELKLRLNYTIFSLILTFITCYIYINQIIYLLTYYLLYNMNSHRFIFTKLTEVFYTYIQFASISSLLICFPFILFNLWLFFIPGLYKYEKFFFDFYFLFILFLFFSSFFISYNYIIPNILRFFLLFENNNLYFSLHFEAKIQDYLIPIYILLFNLILCFQFPSLIILLLYFELITYNLLIENRKYFFIFFLFFSALIAPPDIYSQVFLTLIMLFIYELLLFLLFFFRNLFFVSQKML